jgi:hypothetical protein
MLLCNNSAIRPVCRIIRASAAQLAGPAALQAPIIAAMSDADDLAQRYLGLWTQYLTALLADPGAMETLKRWLSLTGQFAYPAPGATGQGGAPVPAWPPFFGPFGLAPAPPAAAAPAPPAEGTAELARRIDELERRLAKLEGQLAPPRPHRRTRTGGRA